MPLWISAFENEANNLLRVRRIAKLVDIKELAPAVVASRGVAGGRRGRAGARPGRHILAINAKRIRAHMHIYIYIDIERERVRSVVGDVCAFVCICVGCGNTRVVNALNIHYYVKQT